MINFSEIEKFYSGREKEFKRSILREYIQCKILKIIFDSEYGLKLSFIGGTALRLCYNNQRFSEDIDFDNFGLTIAEFKGLSNIIKYSLEQEGFIIEIKIVHKTAFRCYIKIPELLYSLGFSNLSEEKILIQFDTESQKYDYIPDKIILNKFDVFTQINVTPLNILLSQKIFASVNRKTTKGRDFYDLTFLFAKTVPDYGYLNLKLNLKDKKQLKELLLRRIQTINLKSLVRDIKPFLIVPNDEKRVALFEEFVRQL